MPRRAPRLTPRPTPPATRRATPRATDGAAAEPGALRDRTYQPDEAQRADDDPRTTERADYWDGRTGEAADRDARMSERAPERADDDDATAAGSRHRFGRR